MNFIDWIIASSIIIIIIVVFIFIIIIIVVVIIIIIIIIIIIEILQKVSIFYIICVIYISSFEWKQKEFRWRAKVTHTSGVARI